MAQLPALGFNPRNALLDFSPINDAIDSNRKNALMQRESARQDDQIAMQKDNQQYQRGRDAQADNLAKIKRGGEVALAIQNMRDDDPAKQAAWGRYLKTFGDGDHSPEELDFRTGPKLASAAAGKFLDPIEQQAKQLEIRHKQAQINALNRRELDQNTPAIRAKNAQALGIDPNSDAYRSYVLTGKLPREDQQSLTATDKKAILEADEAVGSNRAAISAIDEATKLNPKANSGWGAGIRASMGANLPDWIVPDAVSSPESSQATIDFDNAVVGQALTSLKSIFGGNPTEGERKILLDLQGSSGKPAAVRQEILGRARRAAENRLKLNEQRSNELRGGTFYKPGGGSAASNPMSYGTSAGDPLAEAKAAIAKGAPRDAVIKRLQEMGVNPEGF